MAQYSPETLAALRHAYVHTDQPMRLIANDHGIGITTLQTLAEKNGWPKRSQRQRGHPPATGVVEKARLLEEQMREAARRSEAGSASQETPTRLAALATLPLAGGGIEKESGGGKEGAAAGADGAQAHTRATIDLLECETRGEIEQLHADRTRNPGQQRKPGESASLARRLSDLSLTVQRIERMRRGLFNDPPPQQQGYDEDDDDIPQDIDAFRLDLARRIEAFVASREDDEDGAEDPDTPVDEVQP